VSARPGSVRRPARRPKYDAPWALDDPASWSEAEFSHRIKLIAIACGWHIPIGDLIKRDEDAAALGVTLAPEPLPGIWMHHGFSLGSEPGWPDLTLVRRADRRLVFAELKTDKKTSRLSVRQEAVLELLRCLEDRHVDPVRGDDGTWHSERRGPRIEVFCWRPSDEALIREVLA
jgi:hypothetical protein